MKILDDLIDRKQFVVYRVFPQPSGKLDKIPVSPRTGHRIDGQDSQNWMLPHEALLHVQTLGPGHGVGLVIYEGCGLACIDLDHCRDPSGGWQPHAAAFAAWFPGAATETSYSGTGRHILLSYRVGVIPTHGTRNAVYRMEAYTARRFIALTGTEEAGSILVDHTTTFARFLADYFPPRTAADDRTGQWTSTPLDGGTVPEDDTELLQRALRSAGIKARLGTKAAFADLWSAEPEVLSRAYPSQTGKAWDGSAADQALANHLAFWTRNDCERMLRLMRGSTLRREKWDREDYLPRTILEACSQQTEWYSDPNLAQTPRGQEVGTTGPLSIPPATPDSDQPVPLPPIDTAPAPPSQAVTLLYGSQGHEVAQGAPGQLPTGTQSLKAGEIPAPGAYLTISMMRQVFADHAYVRELKRIQIPNGLALTKDQFDATYGGVQWSMTPDGQRPGKSAWEAYLDNQLYRFPQVDTQCFLPHSPTGAIRHIYGRREINSYRPAHVTRAAGDPTPFITHLQKLLPNDWELMLWTLAGRVQFIGRKYMWAPFLQGCKGNGKTLLSEILGYAIGEEYVHRPKSDQIEEKFNDVFSNKLLLVIDELPKNGYDIEPVLNTLVTSVRLEVRPMYGEKVMKDVCFNTFFIANYQSSLQCDPDQRRYAPFFCAQQRKADLTRDGLTPAYFIAFRDWLKNGNGYAICAEYLHTLVVPEHMTPENCIRAPETSATHTAHAASMGPAEQEIHHAVEQQLEGFRNGWINSHAVDMLLARMGKDKAIPRNARDALIENTGYVAHPSLHGGLCDVAMPDGTRPRLYILHGHPWAVAHLSARQVRDGYLEAQKK